MAPPTGPSGLPGIQWNQVHHPGAGDPMPSFGWDDLSTYDLPGIPPPRPDEQTSFSDDFSNLTNFLNSFANPDFNPDTSIAPLGLDPHHTENWLLGHTTTYAPFGASQPPLQDFSPTILAGLNPQPFRLALGPNTVAESGHAYQGDAYTDYVPAGRHSMPQNHNPFQRAGISHQFRTEPQMTQVPSRQMSYTAQYGSDESFNHAQFQPQSHEDTTDDVESRHSALLRSMFQNNSAAPTRVPSPVQQSRFLPLNGPPSQFFRTHPDDTRCQEIQDAEGPPSKRRKSSDIKFESPTDGVADGHILDEPSPEEHTEKELGRQSSDKAAKTAATPSRRKRSGPKKPKTNLTELERRRNHIKSENKRRCLVSEGFDVLRTLVPGITQNTSKNGVLIATAEWLGDLKASNGRLQSLLDDLPEEGPGGLVEEGSDS